MTETQRNQIREKFYKEWGYPSETFLLDKMADWWFNLIEEELAQVYQIENAAKYKGYEDGRLAERNELLQEVEKKLADKIKLQDKKGFNPYRAGAINEFKGICSYLKNI